MLGKVEICGVNTAKLPTLKSDEMTELLRRSHLGDERARETLIQGNLRLVLSVIQRFASRGENADDLFQVGCVGLIKAIDNFDVSQNVRFSTYGVPMIIGEIRRYLRDNSAIRVSRSMRDTAYRVLQAREKLQRENQREPTVEQIAKELDLPREEVVFAMDAVVSRLPLRPRLLRRRRHRLRDGSGARHAQHRRKLARPDRSARSGGQALAARAAYFSHALLRRQDADGGLRRDRHFAGAGLAAGEKRHQHHPQESLTAS